MKTWIGAIALAFLIGIGVPAARATAARGLDPGPVVAYGPHMDPCGGCVATA